MQPYSYTCSPRRSKLFFLIKPGTRPLMYTCCQLVIFSPWTLRTCVCEIWSILTCVITHCNIRCNTWTPLIKDWHQLVCTCFPWAKSNHKTTNTQMAKRPAKPQSILSCTETPRIHSKQTIWCYFGHGGGVKMTWIISYQIEILREWDINISSDLYYFIHVF